MRLCIDEDQPVDTDLVLRIIGAWRAGVLPRLQRFYNYVRGDQDILHKRYSDPGKPCNHIVTNYCDNIVSNYAGYLCGKPVTYKSDEDIQRVQEVLKYNDVRAKDSELLRTALTFGIAYELHYTDSDGKERFDILDPRTGIPVYDNTLEQNLRYFIRLYPKNTLSDVPETLVDLYTADGVTHYHSSGGQGELVEDGTDLHYFGQVPVTVFSLNAEELPIFYQIMSLQDAYNTLLSSEVDDFEAFCDAYLVLTGMAVDPEDIRTMKKNRVLVIPESGASAEYLTKSVSDTQIQNMLQNINDTIHKIANSPDFSQESFGVSSGIALRYRLLGFENAAAAIESNMVKALQKRIELICDILHLTGGEEVWRDVEIVIGRNLPVNYDELVALVNSLRGVVSDKTLLSLLPFVTDVDAELNALEDQKAESMELYGFEGPATGESEGSVNEQEER